MVSASRPTNAAPTNSAVLRCNLSPELIVSPNAPPPMYVARAAVPTLITRAVRTPARMTGTARGSSMRVSTWNPEYPMPLPASM